ncbi:MAG: TatD family hydrolase [bacterium]
MSDQAAIIDTHCHLRLIDGADGVAGYVAAAAEAGVAALINVGFDDATNSAVIEEAARFPGVYCSQGVHPHEAATATEATFDWISAHLTNPKVVALGEMGLDYFKEYAPIPVQHAVFERQLALAAETGLPVIIHSRDAVDDTHAMLKNAALPQGGIMHCYAYDTAWAERFIELGFDISFSGVVTFKKAEALHAAARDLPLDRVHVETDSPWLAPVPHRGQTNQPAYVVHTARCLADLRGASFDTVAAQLWANALRRFPRLNPLSEAPSD